MEIKLKKDKDYVYAKIDDTHTTEILMPNTVNNNDSEESVIIEALKNPINSKPLDKSQKKEKRLS